MRRRYIYSSPMTVVRNPAHIIYSAINEYQRVRIHMQIHEIWLLPAHILSSFSSSSSIQTNWLPASATLLAAADWRTRTHTFLTESNPSHRSYRLIKPEYWRTELLSAAVYLSLYVLTCQFILCSTLISLLWFGVCVSVLATLQMTNRVFNIAALIFAVSKHQSPS